jgi:hypothetical protein
MEVGQQRQCGFNASVLPREGKQQDEALPEDEVVLAILS